MSSKKTTTQNSTSTTTPINPQWVIDPIRGGTEMIQRLQRGETLPTDYNFGPRPTEFQNSLFQIGQNLAPQSENWLGSSADALGDLLSYAPQQVGAGLVSGQSVAPTEAFASLGAADPTQALASALSGAPSNPYLGAMNQANINQSLQGYNDALSSAANTLSRSVLPSIRSGGVLAGQYGGSRQGIAEGVALGDLGTQLGQNARNLAQSAMDSGNQLYGGAYENAQQRAASTAATLAGLGLQNAQGNAERLQQAQTTNVANGLQAAMANQSAGLQGANLNLSAAQGLGGLGQYGLGAASDLAAQQQALDAAYRRAPLDLAQATTGMYGQMPYNLFNGSTNTSTGKTVEKSSNPMGAVMNLANLATMGINPTSALGGLGKLFGKG